MRQRETETERRDVGGRGWRSITTMAQRTPKKRQGHRDDVETTETKTKRGK